MLLYCRHDEDMSKQDRFSDECGLTFALGQRIIACALIDDQSLVKSWCSVLSLEDLGVEINYVSTEAASRVEYLDGWFRQFTRF